MAAPTTSSIVCPTLIGRAGQRDTLLRLAEEARAGRGQVALLAGEAGIGKSRLVAEVVAGLDTRARVLYGRCFEPDRALPYAPLLDLLRAFFGPASLPALAEHLGPAAPELVKLLPELAYRIPGLAPSPTLEPEQEKRRLFEVLAQFFLRLAARRPLILVIEDIHWSDATGLDVLLHLARRLAGRPLLLILTYRSDEVGPDLAALLAALDRERLASELTLARLALDETDALLRAIFAQRRPVRPDFLAALHALTEGNPFFIEEVLKSLVAAGDIFFADGQWDRKPLGELNIPRSVQTAVQRRLEGLQPAARRVLDLAAVAGRRFDFALLQALTGQGEAAVLAAVKELIAAQLVVEESAEQCAFRHALTQQAVYAALLARERRALHLAVGEVIERGQVDRPDAPWAELARHFRAAEAWPKVLDYAPRAGARARELYAPRAAFEQFTAAIEAAGRLALPVSASLLRARGQVGEILGEFEAARDDYARTIAVARAAGDRADECTGLLDLGWLWTGRDYERAGAYFAAAIELARAMDDPSRLAQTLNRVGNWHLHAERPEEALRCHEEALHLFAGLGDRHSQATTLDLLGITGYMGGDIFTGARHYGEAVALCRALGDRQRLASTLMTLALRCGSYHLAAVAWPAAEFAACAGEIEEALAIARQIGWRAGEATVLLYRCFMLGPRGEFAAALAAGRDAVAITAELDQRIWGASAHNALGGLYLDLLDLPAARRELERSLALAREAGSLFVTRIATGLLASTCLAQGDLGAATTVVEAALSPDTPMRTTAQRLAWCARAEVATARGAPGEALAICDGLIAAVPETAEGVVIPQVWSLRGEALAALGRAAEAEAVLGAALDAARAHGLAPLAWRLHARLGRLRAEQGRRAEAGESYAAARAIIADLAARLPEGPQRQTFLDGALARLPHRPAPTALRAAKAAYGGLTAREREVAALIARGLANRDIAAALSLSERTVGAHIGNILAKLDFSSRAQIAVWAVERGLAREAAPAKT